MLEKYSYLKLICLFKAQNIVNGKTLRGLGDYCREIQLYVLKSFWKQLAYPWLTTVMECYHKDGGA